VPTDISGHASLPETHQHHIPMMAALTIRAWW